MSSLRILYTSIIFIFPSLRLSKSNLLLFPPKLACSVLIHAAQIVMNVRFSTRALSTLSFREYGPFLPQQLTTTKSSLAGVEPHGQFHSLCWKRVWFGLLWVMCTLTSPWWVPLYSHPLPLALTLPSFFTDPRVFGRQGTEYMILGGWLFQSQSLYLGLLWSLCWLSSMANRSLLNKPLLSLYCLWKQVTPIAYFQGVKK